MSEEHREDQTTARPDEAMKDQTRSSDGGEQSADDRGVKNPGMAGEDQVLTEVEEKVLGTLKTVYDPEIPVNICDLGLIYVMDVDEENKHVDIQMTLTAPGCPVAGTFPDTVRLTVEGLAEVDTCEVELVWYPPWSPDMMSEAAKLELGFF